MELIQLEFAVLSITEKDWKEIMGNIGEDMENFMHISLQFILLLVLPFFLLLKQWAKFYSLKNYINLLWNYLLDFTRYIDLMIRPSRLRHIALSGKQNRSFLGL